MLDDELPRQELEVMATVILASFCFLIAVFFSDSVSSAEFAAAVADLRFKLRLDLLAC